MALIIDACGYEEVAASDHEEVAADDSNAPTKMDEEWQRCINLPKFDLLQVTCFLTSFKFAC